VGDAPELSYFGYDIFGPGGDEFRPAENVPAPSGYTLSSGDVVRVQLFGNQNETLNLTVTRDGAINFPKLGPVQVAGLRLEDVQSLIERRVSKELIGVQSNVTLGPMRGIQIFLLGDVNAPGSYTVSGLATVSNALALGGGIRTSGSLRDVQLKRGGRVIRRLDLYSFLLSGNATGDQRLQSGDVVFVPAAGPRVAISGAVRRPAIYEIRDQISTGALLSMAGGLTSDARKTQAMMERRNSNGQRTLSEVNLATAQGLAQRLTDGDSLTVLAASGAVENRVEVIGHVRYPAFYAHRTGLKLSRLLSMAQVKPSSVGVELYPALALIERGSETSGIRQWQSFDLAAVLAGRSDMALHPEDRVAVLTRNDVEFLSSALVRAALRGELPREALLVNPESRLDRPVGSQKKRRPLAFPSEVSSFEDTQAPEPVRALEYADEASVGAICLGLLEVAKISDSARALAIRLALNAQESTSEIKSRTSEDARKQAERPAECPKLFEQAPTALVALLEHGVAVIGEVLRPGLYPLPRGASFAQLLTAAGGPTPEANQERLDVYAPQISGPPSSPRFQPVALAELGPNHSVRPGEIYQLKAMKTLPEVGSVTVGGEVRFPGRYVIARGERMSDLIQRAGGLNPEAYPYGAVFTRQSTRDGEAVSNRRAAADLRDALATAVTKGSLSQGQSPQSAAFLSEVVQRLETEPTVGRIVIEADPTALLADATLNLLLEPGDNLFIPKRPSSVTVTGQVLNPGSFSFKASGEAKDYLQQAGGFAEAADDDRVMILLPNGVARPLKRSWFAYQPEPIPPGSVIVVPRDAAPLTGLLLTERIASIVSNLALSAAALVTINR
jgi:protein involved in polysaccharide export with SLBB domain